MRAQLDVNGHEVFDQTPVELPVGFRHPPTLIEQVRRMIRHEVSQVASREGYESFDDADDFDVDDDPDLKSPYELSADQEGAPPLAQAVQPRKKAPAPAASVASPEPPKAPA